MIFALIIGLTHGLEQNLDKLGLMHPPFLLGLIAGGAVIYWFTGASTQAVSTSAYRGRVHQAEHPARWDCQGQRRGLTPRRGYLHAVRSVRHVQHLPGSLLSTLAFAFYESYFFIGFLIATPLFGLFQAIFMANAGGAWDNAKKIVETELKAKGTDLHAATVVGDTVGDPFKDTSSVALNPVIKFSTLFGLLAVELAISIKAMEEVFGLDGVTFAHVLAVVFFLVSLFFVWRSFYRMQIGHAPARRD